MQKQLSVAAFLLILVLLTFSTRLLSLSDHWLSDESLWMERSRTFVLALERGNFANTLTAYHPGVTTTWLGGAAIWGASGGHLVSDWVQPTQFFSPTMLARMRFPIAFLTGVLVLLSGLLLHRLFSEILAVVGTFFLSIEPFLLAESRRIHTDALTAEFLFLTLLLWLCYLESETPRRRDLVFSGICFGLACLTKSHAGAFLIFLPLLLFWYVKQRGLSGAKMLMSVFLFFSVTLLTVISFWPYLWTFTLWNIPISPLLFFGCVGTLLWSWKKLSMQILFSRIELLILGGSLFLIVGIACSAAPYVLSQMYIALTNAHELPKLFLGNIRYNPGSLFYLVMIFVWSAPLTIPLTILAIYKAWQQRHQDKKHFRITVVLFIFGLFYLIGLSLVAKKIARYLVILLPAVSILAAMGAIHLTQYVSKNRIRYLFLAVVVVLQVVPVLQLHPYYITYHFPLLSGKWVSKNTTLGGGVGLDVAAAYLNAKPDAQNLKVRISPFSSTLNKYFYGKTWRMDSTEIQFNNVAFDYDVEYVRGRQIQGVPMDSPPEKGVPPAAFQLNNALPRELEHVVQLNRVNYVWIYRVLTPRTRAAPVKRE